MVRCVIALELFAEEVKKTGSGYTEYTIAYTLEPANSLCLHSLHRIHTPKSENRNAKKCVSCVSCDENRLQAT